MAAALLCAAIGPVPQDPVSLETQVLLETTVGMRGRIEELPLPGSPLRAVDVEDPQKADAIVRVIEVLPHGTAFRYTLEVTPLVAGRLDLRDHLEREDGTTTDDLPELLVEVRAVLPFTQVEPNALELTDPDRVGGYRAWQIAAAVFWVAGLLAILFVGRRRRQARDDGKRQTVLTLADRLRPLVEAARTETLDPGGRAELERLILAHWRQRRNLEGVKAAEAIATLRRDPEAGALLFKLEEWLHSPVTTDSVDVASLLEPYRNVTDIPAGETA